MARGDHRDVSRSEAPARTDALARTPTALDAPPLDLEGLKIERDCEVPIGVQLAWAIRARIGDGRLGAGQRLPGLRELAEMLGINANTARAVYQRLEQEGLIDSRQGMGTFVASAAQESSAVGQIAADAALQAHRTGVDPREVAAALYVTAEPAANVSQRAAERRKELRAQIAALEQTLSEIQTSSPGLIPAPSEPLRHAGPRLLSVTELERVRAGLLHRLATAEPLLETASDDKQTARSRRLATPTSRPATQAPGSSKQAKSATAKKPPRARGGARTRPSTA
jgi:GntR family transcriptional regulator